VSSAKLKRSEALDEGRARLKVVPLKRSTADKEKGQALSAKRRAERRAVVGPPPPATVASEAELLVSEGLATVAEACGFLGLAQSSVYELMGAGELKYVTIGRSRRIPWRALRELAVRGLVGG